MPQNSSNVAVFQTGLRRWLRRSAVAACGLAVFSQAVSSVIADDAATPHPLMQSSKLRMEARLAAEQGDFLTAADLLEDAAMVVGDRTTAEQAGQARDGLQAGGGAQVDFDTLINLIMEQTSPPALWIQQGDEIGSMTPYLQGVFIGSPAVLGTLAMSTNNSQLMRIAELAETANHNADVRESSTLRLVSLPRLEAHVQALRAAGEPLPDDVMCLAGLTRVQYLFVFPGTGDVVIGGPAGDWKTTEDGRSVSLTDNRPTLQFDDLVTLSRTFASGGAGFLMCSIDPKAEQVKAVQEYAAQNRQLTAGNVRKFTEQLEDMLGLQNVIVQGVPDDSRVAKVIVEADYQMKRIGIGEREGVEGMKSYFDLVGKDERKGSAMDALRWWMTVGYDSINVSPDRRAFEFSGQSVQCLSENQLVKNDGSRASTGTADKANEQFAQLFTKNLPELADQDVVFADLQNVFDLSLATALMHAHGLDRVAGWKPVVLSNSGDYQPAPVDVPDELMTAANSRVYRGGDIVIQVAGGIRADLRSVVLNRENYKTTEVVSGSANAANPVGQSGRWWWDAAAR